jgi:hypothetical protein
MRAAFLAIIASQTLTKALGHARTLLGSAVSEALAHYSADLARSFKNAFRNEKR